jgi:hypothetical protein
MFRAPAWLSKSKRFLCGVPRESSLPIFHHWSNCDWRVISGNVGKLVVIPTEYQLWRLNSSTGWSSLPPPHSHRNVRVLNRVLPQRWIGRAENVDNKLLPWPPRSPDIRPCDFFLVKDSVYVPLLSTPIEELRDRIAHALQAITADKLLGVWNECDYRVDVCRVTQGAHIEGL